MNSNNDYYARHAVTFFQSTVNVDMAVLYERFLASLPEGAHVLDAGCGSGRDAKAFASRGYRVTAFDASPELARLATAHCGFEVGVRRFADVDEVAAYDAIWCCASLLHVPEADMPSVLARLWRALRPCGRLYVSFKHGTGERDHQGRRFTDADEATLRRWLADQPEVEDLDIWLTDDQRPDRADRWLNAIVTRTTVPPRKLVTGGDDPFLPHLSEAMARATDIDLAVAFIKTTGLRLLLPDLRAALEAVEPSRRVRVLTSDYLDVTDPEALRLLLLLQDQGAEVRVYVTGGGSFHLKAYVLSSLAGGELKAGTAFIGSSNISRQALKDGLEWNYRVVYPGDPGFLETRERFEALYRAPQSLPLSNAWIDAYERRRVPPPRAIAPGTTEQDPPPQPTVVQRAALEALDNTRRDGFLRGLVVLATGLGKTWLAAFDAAQMGARRVLFVAHREEILAQAAATFVRIRPQARVGLYVGANRDAEVDVLCASVQTLAKAAHLEKFAPQHFDYVVVDEFHHAAATTYRRLLAHFAPSFMLGLTATPDRSDQSDILSLCDDNLVHTCDLFDGIESKLLAPFHYHGILDESVNYAEVPWRNGRFDPESLSSKLATLARSRHALREWRAKAQRRTLAFCVSVRHADYMAAQFMRAGVAAAAVYAGSELGRAQALERLNAGELQVLFTVDLFNEGVDLPSIDTVMMLRPTESKILFLQQLGRGLRRSEGKTHLVVLDFIGNHQSFLHKPQALLGAGATFKDLAGFARRLQAGQLQLPEGCYVNYDLQLIDFLKSLDSSGPQKDYEALKAVLGRRPSLLEYHRAGASLPRTRQQFGHWFAQVQAMGDLAADQVETVGLFGALLLDVEVTAMTKSFKMVLLEAFLELDGLRRAPTLHDLAVRSWQVLQRRPGLLQDVPPEQAAWACAGDARWLQYWRGNPVQAWTGGYRTTPATALFAVQEDVFTLAANVPAALVDTLSDQLQELVDFRLATYLARRPAANDDGKVIPFPGPKGADEHVSLPFFTNLRIACGHFRASRTDAEEYRQLPPHYGRLDPTRHFIARAAGHSMDGGKQPIRDGDHLLMERITPASAGAITGAIVAIERQDGGGGDNAYLLRVVTKNKAGDYVLRANNPDYEDLPASDDMRTLARFKAIVDPLDLAVGQEFLREDIPPLFGESFNPGSWNVGHVVLNDKKAHILLVTLNKQGKAEDHRYVDHWIDDQTFHWQSQNRTTPSDKRGREIVHHAELGIAVHLFVRNARATAAGKAAKFVYFGPVQYQRHSGSAPMSVIFRR